MSGYQRHQERYAYDAEATRPNQAPAYAGIAPPSFASQYPDAPTRLTHEPSSAEMPFIPSSTYGESRGTGAFLPDPSFMAAGSRHPAFPTVTASEVSSYVNPSQGNSGSKVVLQLRTKFDLQADQPIFTFMFGKSECEAKLSPMDQDDEYYNYALNVEVPPFPLTNSFNPTMMLKLKMEDREGHFLNEIDAGKFTYTDMRGPYKPKRKHSETVGYGEVQDYSDAKRTNSLHFQNKQRSVSGAFSAASASPLQAQSSLSNTYNYHSGYDLSKQPAYTTPSLSQKELYAIPSGMGMTPGDMKPPQMSPNLQSSYSHYNPITRSPASTASHPSRSTVLPSPKNPSFVRTNPQAGSSSSSQSFNPYLIYPSKAVLKIEGDLDQMASGWSTDEYEARRRLVQFHRSQDGSVITTTFAPVSPEARQPRSICVSCILWEEKDECFITSVDTIYLLEQLVNVRFTVEEKNRIRRNLEGFRPLTVSKAKSDSEEFFKVIMGFPNPKPRNIEKDVKVFPWKILAHALKKIISKYSASYSSTAGAGALPSSNSSYVQVGIPGTGNNTGSDTGPRFVVTGTTATASPPAYAGAMTSASLSPHLKASAGLEASAGYGLTAPQRGPTSQGITPWGAAIPHEYTGMPQGGRGSWDYSGYLSTPSAGVPPAAQSMQMQPSDATQDLSQMSADNPYQQYGHRTTRV